MAGSTDTCVIIANFGKNKARTNSFTTAFSQLQLQNLNVEFILCELLMGDRQESIAPPDLLRKLRYIPVIGDERNQYLWQKELLMNIAARSTDKQNLIFLDSDIYSEDPTWFDEIRASLVEEPERLIQPFSKSQDTLVEDMYILALGHRFDPNIEVRKHIGPGLAWAMTRTMFEKLDGFNPYCIEGSADTMLVIEAFNGEDFWPSYKPGFLSTEWLKKVRRPVESKADYGMLDHQLVHVNHGPIRNYFSRAAVLDLFSRNIPDFTSVGDNGLLQWDDMGCPERMLLKREFEKIAETYDFQPMAPLFKELKAHNGIRSGCNRFSIVDLDRLMFAKLTHPEVSGCVETVPFTSRTEMTIDGGAGKNGFCGTMEKWVIGPKPDQGFLLRLRMKADGPVKVRLLIVDGVRSDEGTFYNLSHLCMSDIFDVSHHWSDFSLTAAAAGWTGILHGIIQISSPSSEPVRLEIDDLELNPTN